MHVLVCNVFFLPFFFLVLFFFIPRFPPPIPSELRAHITSFHINLNVTARSCINFGLLNYILLFFFPRLFTSISPRSVLNTPRFSSGLAGSDSSQSVVKELRKSNYFTSWSSSTCLGKLGGGEKEKRRKR